MRKLDRYLQLFSIAFTFVIASSFSILEEANPEHLFVIGNSPTVKSSLTEKELHDILFYEKRVWDQGEPIVIAVMNDRHPTYDLVAKDLYQKTGKEVRLIWLEAVLQTAAESPKKFHYEEDLVEFVSKTPGSIGFISKKTKPTNVKTLNIND